MKGKRTLASALSLCLLAITVSTGFADTGTGAKSPYSLNFDAGTYTTASVTANGKTVPYRAYEKVVYVQNPVDTKYQCMNIYIPEAYFEGKSIGAFNAGNAPIFLPNSVGGYMPSEPGSPARTLGGMPAAQAQSAGSTAPNSSTAPATPPASTGTAPASTQIPASDSLNAMQTALSKGYVVAAPGARGRTTKDAGGTYTGKAPAAIVDLKAAVRYLRHNDAVMPGSAERIISNGTSAGGALSALLGATGNNADYAPYLKALGAAEERDDIYAVSAYCPITNLDHADAAYEWMFSGVNDYKKIVMSNMTDWRVERKEVAGTLTDDQIRISGLLKAEFPAYVNSLGLKGPDGTLLTLDADGNGTFKDAVKALVMASAQKALDKGTDLSSLTWLTIRNGKVTDIDLAKYAAYATRMKLPGAFDALDLSAGENSLFGTATVDTQHFTAFGIAHSTVGGTLADAGIVKLMNPMNYIGADGTVTAKFFRIRHGSVDRDTSLAIPAILATTLANKGCTVDFAVPWGQGHGGDYDLPELFAWMDGICKTAPSGMPAPGKDSTPQSRAIVPSTASVTVNGKKIDFKAYNIDGSNYFKLRDLAKAMNFSILWDEGTETIRIDTSKAFGNP